MKDIFHRWFKIIFYYTLRNAVAYRWNAQRALSALLLWNKYRSYGWWKITTRGHAVPQPIQILSHVFIEHFNAFMVYPRTAIFRCHLQVAVIHHPLTNG